MLSPHIDFEHLKKAHWTSTETENAKRVVEFVQTLMNDHNYERVLSIFGDQPYRQHNRSMKDGIGGVVSTLEELTKRFPEFSYDVKHVYVDGDFVTLHSHATMKVKHRGNDRQGFNIMDTWKVEEGKLVEHWDAVQALSFPMRIYALLTGGAIRNSNGVF